MSDTRPPPHLVDVIIPVHAIGPVMADTVLSVFAQQGKGIRLRCLVVVDGCPMMETTSALLTDLSGAGDHEFEVIYQKNSGVVGARNTAIRHIMGHTERADFVLFLDGDDLLAPNYIAESIAAITGATPPDGRRAGWAYADQFHFGDVTHWTQYPTRMWPARFAQNNLSQPSSLISIDLLEAGLRFDPRFNLGIEDWDFWCSAVNSGFTGVHVRNSYVFYRRLTGSRSSFNRSNDGLTRFYMANKHGLNSHAFITTDAGVFPRAGALIATAEDTALADRLEIPASVRFAAASKKALKVFGGRLAVRSRYRHDGVLDYPYTPALMVLATQGDTTPVDRSVLFAAEHMFKAEPDLVFIEIRTGDSDGVLLGASDRFYERAGRRKPAPKHRVMVLDPQAGLHPGADPRDMAAGFQAVTQRLMDHLPSHLPRAQKWLTLNIVGTQLSTHADFFTAALGYLPLWPTRAEAGGPTRAGFVLPADGQGVDHGALARLMAACQAKGYRPMAVLVLPGSQGLDPAFHTDIAARFGAQGVITMHDVLSPNPNARDQAYNGVPLKQSEHARIAYLTGVLSHFGKIVNFGVLDATIALAGLKAARRTENIYVPSPANPRMEEIEHLCAFLTVYAHIDTDDIAWVQEAAGLGVRETTLPAGLGYDPDRTVQTIGGPN